MKNYQVAEIVNLFKKHVPLDRKYYDKYTNPPFHLQDSRWMWSGHDYPRIPCLLDFREWIDKYNLSKPKKLLYTSNDDPELLYLYPENKKLIEYDFNTNENDLHTLDLVDKDFDFVLFSQTLEHLYDPKRCIENLRNHMIPGGHIFTSVPTINIMHMTPIHFWGINQIGLILLFDSLNFEILQVGQWGNSKYINHIFTTQKWPDYKELIDEKGQIHNEFQNAAQTWILAKKI